MAAALKSLGRYELGRVLGKGNMGVVYEATDTRLRRTVAIKTIIKSRLQEDAAKSYSARFLREAEALAQLNHPNIIQVYDFGEEGDVAYIVMEFLQNGDLKDMIDVTKKFAVKDAVRIMSELLDALDFAHEKGVIHRDIKPANVMFDAQGRVKLADFGVARVENLEGTSAEHTQAGTQIGTPAYMSPEQVRTEQIDRRSDIFSAGVILYQLLTGERPFQGEGVWTIQKKIVSEEPKLPSTIRTEISPEYDRVIGKALAKDREDRFSTGREFKQALQKAFEYTPPPPEDATVLNTPSSYTPAAQQPTVPPKPRAAVSTQTQELELEFWRSIKDSDDPEDYESYIEQFPDGTYAALAQRKAVRLRRGTAPSDRSGSLPSSSVSQPSPTDLRRVQEEEERVRQQAELKKRQEAEERARREAEEQAKREEERRAREAFEKAKREEESRARKEIEERARREAAEQAKRDADERARREVERIRRETEERAAREAAEAKARTDAEKSRREAQERLEAEKARQEAQNRARREAEERAKREAEEFAKREAAETARRQAEERARREAEEKARREVEEVAKREAEAKARKEAEERRRQETQEKARKEAEALARREAEEKKKREAEDLARLEQEAKARREADEAARLEAEEKARRERSQQSARQIEEKARREQEQRLRTGAVPPVPNIATPPSQATTARAPEVVQGFSVEARKEFDPDQTVVKQPATARQSDPFPAFPRSKEEETLAGAPSQAKAGQSRGLMIGAGIAVVVIAGGGIAYFMSSSGTAPPATVATSAPSVTQKPAQPSGPETTNREQAPVDISLPTSEQGRKEETKKDSESKAAAQGAAVIPLKPPTAPTTPIQPVKPPAVATPPVATKPVPPAVATPPVATKPVPPVVTTPPAATTPPVVSTPVPPVVTTPPAVATPVPPTVTTPPVVAKPPAPVVTTPPAVTTPGPTVVATLPTIKPPAPPTPPVVSPEALYKEGIALLAQNPTQGVRKLREAAFAGSGPAAKRLGEIYDRGQGEVGRDYQDSLRFYGIARKLGETVPVAGGR